MFSFITIVGAIVWVLTSIMFAAVFGAMFSPEKNKIVSRSIISILLLVPALFVVPLGFIAGVILIIIGFIVCISIFGVRITLELIVDGIPEMDEDGNYVQEKVKPTAPWV